MKSAERPHRSAHDLRIAMHAQNQDTGEKKRRTTLLQKESVYSTVQMRRVLNFRIHFFLEVTGMISPVRLLCCNRSTGQAPTFYNTYSVSIQQRASPLPQNITGLKTKDRHLLVVTPMLNLPICITLQNKHTSTIIVFQTGKQNLWPSRRGLQHRQQQTW